VLPGCVAFVFRGEAFGNCQALLVSIKRILEIAYQHLDIADPVVTGRQIPLPN